MGPRLFRRGNSHSRDLFSPTQWELQWGHAYSGVETGFSTPKTWCSMTGFNGATPIQAWKPGVPGQ